MAESAPEQRQCDVSREEQQAQRKLKHLDFFRLAVVQAVLCLTRVYGFAKENSGPLRPGVEAVEGAGKTVLGPVYERFRGVTYELLKFVDRKVDESMTELGRFVPPAVKEASTQAYTVTRKAPEIARSAVSEVQRAGVIGTATGLARTVAARCEPAAKQVYARYEPVAEHYAVATWRALNGLPLFHQVAHIAVPTAAHWTEKYNGAVRYGAEKGYAVATYLPLVPTERIAKVFGSAGGVAPAAEAQ